MDTVSGYSSKDAKLGSPRVSEMSRERVSRAPYSKEYTPDGSEYIVVVG